VDELDRQLLNSIQADVPLVVRPFGQLAGRLGCDEAAVIKRIAALRQAGIIREISAIFDAVALGYRQALVALGVPADGLDQAGQIAASHPGVSHCYGRSGEMNLWLTLATSPGSRLGLEASAALLARLSGATRHMVLPTLRRYKLQVRFDMEGDEPTPAQGTGSAAPQEQGACPRSSNTHQHAPDPSANSGDRHLRPGGTARRDYGASPLPPQLTDTQIRVIRALQIDLPGQTEPFAPLAAAEALDVDTLLDCGRRMLESGHMRRYAAVLHHRAAGGKVNVLVAWAADPAQADADGPRAAQVAGISHCYLRPAGPGWPYNLYTMIHGRSEQDCRLAIETILATTSLTGHVELWTTAEFKKRRVRLFGPEEEQWEAKYA
jgi:DNA-binding Lrp family transcriptional regulator